MRLALPPARNRKPVLDRGTVIPGVSVNSMRKVIVIPMRFGTGFGRSQMAFYDILILKGALTCVIPFFQCFFL